MQKVNIDNIKGKVAKENETYLVRDNTFLNNLVLTQFQNMELLV